ncbi:MAG: DUF4157 domain-containing protein, partial [Spirulinaceae cyanobacterium]
QRLAMRTRTHLHQKKSSKSAVKPVQKKLNSLPDVAQAKPQSQSLEEMEISRKNAERLGDHMVDFSQSTPAQAIQTKLTIGEVGDKYEQEADATAAQVVKQINSPASQGSVQREALPEEEENPLQAKLESTIQREALPEEEELQMKPESTLQRKPGEELESSIEQSRGNGQPLSDNIRGPMEESFGVDFSGVTVHTDSQSDQLNKSIQARAFTTGQDVFFRQGAYDPSSQDGQELIAHELTHVVQQNGTGSLQTSIQRYHNYKGFRASDDGKMGVHQNSSVGGQTAYATPDSIKDASDQLKAATSVIGLKPGKKSGQIPDLSGNGHDVVDVVPVNTQNNTEDTDMELWADCGRSAKTVSGMDQGTGQGNASPGAKYSKDGKTKTVTGNDWMEIQKVKMFKGLFSKESAWWEFWKPQYESKLDIKTIDKKLSDYNKLKQDWIKEKDDVKKNNLSRGMAQLAFELDVLARAEYEKLDPQAKDDFDKKAGINMYADPQIGEAFHISTGGKEHPNKPADVGTWNFHWAGAAIKSGSDTITLENYSVSDYQEENKDWVFQMYGVGKKGQSFHEEHKDVHKQHGDSPTSMVAVRKQAQDK